MQSWELALEYADYLIECARQKPMRVIDLNSSNSKWKSVHQKLCDLYVEECSKEPDNKKLRSASHLLEKLVAREKLKCLIINLYPGNEGYSLMLRGKNGTDSETIKLPYEESELLTYIDNEELPPLLVDLLERLQINIFYSGCIITEIRDYRRTSNSSYYECRLVLLRPTTQSLLCDVNAIVSDGQRWSVGDRVALESQLLLATQEPLCLEPNITVALVANRLQYEKHKFNTRPLKRSVRKYSQVAVNRKRKFAQSGAPSYLRLHDFLIKRPDKNKSHLPINLRVGKGAVVDMWKQRSVQLTSPSSEEIEVDKYATVSDKSRTNGENTPVLFKEVVFEMERSNGKLNHSKLTIQQLPSDNLYFGELYIDKDYAEGKKNGCTCRFMVGTHIELEKYIQQFSDLVTEEGRKSVKITTLVPGQPPQVSYTSAQRPLSPLGPTISLMQVQGDCVTSSQTPSNKKPTLKLNLTPNNNSITSMLSPQINNISTSSPSGSVTTTIIQNQSLPHILNQNISSQRSLTRQMALYGTTSRSSSPSPTTVLSTSHTHSNSQKTNPTPPPNARTPTPASSSRRTSVNDATHINLMTQNLQQPGSLAGLIPGADVAALQAANIAPNVNIASVGLAQNLNLQNLASLQSMAGLQGLHNLPNVQVSLTGVSMPPGIAVPVSLAMMNAPTGILVSSLPNLLNTTTAATTTTASLTTSQAANTSSLVTSPSGMVTMVTSTSSSSNPTVIVTSGLMTSPTSVVSSMLPLPIGVPGSITSQNIAAAHFMTNTLKNAQGIRATGPTSLSLLQAQGQPLPLLTTGIQQRQSIAVTPQSGGQQGQAVNNQRPLTPNTPPNSAPPLVASPSSIAGLPQLAPTLNAVSHSASTVMHLTSQQLQKQQQFHALAYHTQHLHLQPIQLQPQPRQNQSHSSRPKNRKRTTPTPPK